MRIITGKARGRKLRAPEGTDTRPTTEAAKEGMFSAVQFDLYDRKVLDLFGGTGQLALEALSRGAATAVILAVEAEDAVMDVRFPAFQILRLISTLNRKRKKSDRRKKNR